MSNPIEIAPTAIDPATDELVHIQFGAVKVDLPSLKSKALPLDLVQLAVLCGAKAIDKMTDEEKTNLFAIVLSWISREHPNLWQEIDHKSGDKLGDLARILQAWATQSGVSPKA